MKMILGLLTAFAVTFGAPAFAGGGGAIGQKFVKVIYLAYGGATTNSGTSYSAAKSFADQDLWSIPAGTVIEKVYTIVDVAITGTTTFDLGDDDGATSFCPNASVTLGTPGVYCNNAKIAGAYLRVETAGASDAADIYVVPTSKYYSAAGKELKLDITTANTAGKMRVVVEGYYAGPQS